ncbi:hypothetical protein [Mesorhizobium sp. NZP2077]|uniref:hypothetical protein n=1 Tax=Mesorhizobium sp. NZP2077 TaxID=2483404 RepID=UPI00155440AE|nr:hypothetical protein [Mesorhizobium sp. NZP2077]QKC83948.1 hypothetical protein EB232_22220 [Mesorhizobium sp. NZP2077]QKD17485.1 hypothetical protein HGP13_21925 [Mesorhizobium sp. NZP2077]
MKKPAASKPVVIGDPHQAGLSKVNREIDELDAAIKLLAVDEKDAEQKLDDDRWRAVGKAMRAAIDRRTKLQAERAERMAGIWIEPKQPAAPAAAPVQHRAWEINEQALKAGVPKYPADVLRTGSKADKDEVFFKEYGRSVEYWSANFAEGFRKQGFPPDLKVGLDFLCNMMGADRASFLWLSHRCLSLETRLAEIESRPVSEQRGNAKPLQRSVTKVLKHGTDGRIEEFEKIEGESEQIDLLARIEALEARPTLKYAGVWNKTIKYSPGDIVSYGGSSWHSNITSTGLQPGADNPASWTLMTKRGRDGKDARP